MIKGIIKTPLKIKGSINTPMIYPPLEDLEITPSGVEQNFKSSKYGYNNVKVKAVASDTLNITPTLEKQEFIGLYGTVNVGKVNSSIDKNIKAENIKQGVSILGVEGSLDSSFYDDYWDAWQDKGNRVNYSEAFRRVAWTPTSFRPKYDVKPTNAYYMLGNGGDYTPSFDLSKHLDDLGIVMDFSNCTQMDGVFADSRFTRLPIIDTRNAKSINNLFAFAFYIKKIDKLILKDDGTQTLDSTFQSMARLEDIEVEGYFGKTFSIQWAEFLTLDSAINIITHLKDLTDSTAQTITFHANVKAKLTNELIASITSKNWTLA